MKMDFENYLREVHGENYTGLDDDMPDAFDNWLTNLQVDDIIEYADKFAEIEVAKVRKIVSEFQTEFDEIIKEQSITESIRAFNEGLKLN